MTVLSSQPPVTDGDALEYPPTWWRRAVGSLVFAVASVVLALAALATVFAPVKLLWPDDSFTLDPGAVFALGLAGLLALIGLWGMLKQTLHGLGYARAPRSPPSPWSSLWDMPRSGRWCTVRSTTCGGPRGSPWPAEWRSAWWP